MSSISKFNQILFYPLIPSLFPVVFLYAQNSHETLFDEFIVSLGIVLFGTLIITLILRLFLRDDAKIAILVFILLALLFFLGPVQWLILHKYQVSILGVPIGHKQLLLPAAIIAGSIGVLVVLRIKRDLTKAVKLIALISIVLVFLNCLHIGFDKWSDFNTKPADYVLTGQIESEILPDIYYIVLDAYGRSDKLRDNMGYDNYEFIHWLTEQGFFVAEESRSNYTFTLASLGSSLSMRYLTPDDDVISLIKSNHVAELLQGFGYQYVHINGSGYGVTKGNKLADVQYSNDPLRLIVNDFSFELLEQTVVFSLIQAIGFDIQMGYWYRHGKAFNSGMAWLQSVPDIEGPTFTFLHSFPPRQPFVFDKNGEYREDFRTYSGLEEYNQLYLDQLSYVNETVSSVVDSILLDSEVEPIIVLQGDHGPRRSSDSFGTIEDPSDSYVDERSAILNAYYFPANCDVDPYPNITPVNTFRLVFDSCLGANVSLVDDYSYWFHEYKKQSASPIEFDNDL